MSEQLKECPFCGGESMRVDVGLAEFTDVEVTCVDCGGNVGNHPSRSEAIRAWNTRSMPAAAWQPIESAPKGVSNGGKLGVTWMMLAIPDYEGGVHTVSGMRVGDMFYAALTFYCGGPFDGKQYEQREVKVNPSHWMPLPESPNDPR